MWLQAKMCDSSADVELRDIRETQHMQHWVHLRLHVMIAEDGIFPAVQGMLSHAWQRSHTDVS